MGSGAIRARLVNGVFGDPIVEVQIRDMKDRVLFDLGDAAALSRTVLHKVSDVFISHAHFDHICGFLHLLRARMTGRYPPCRIYGPPGIHEHILGFIGGFEWDRIGNDGPVFQIAEILADRLVWMSVTVGQLPIHLPDTSINEDILAEREEFTIRGVKLDHGIDVYAYAIELAMRYRIRKDRLDALALEPGPWLAELKRMLAKHETDAAILLPDGRRLDLSSVAAEVVRAVPGNKFIYATDFADTTENRTKITAFASNADLFMCESTFRLAQENEARSFGHLTTRACGEIAAASRVKRLVPFHFSKRYMDDASAVYAEIQDYCHPDIITRIGSCR